MVNKQRLTNQQMTYILVESSKGRSVGDSSTDEILKRSDGSFPHAKTLQRCIKRYEINQNVEYKKNPGRPRLIGERLQNIILNYSKENDDMSISLIKDKLRLNFIGTRGLNNYFLRNKISTLINVCLSKCQLFDYLFV